MSARVGWSRDSGILVATVIGRIDNANSSECAEMLESGAGEEEQSLILNLSQLSYISSAGLRVLLLTAKRFTGTGQAFGLCELSSGVGEVIYVSGFADIIPVYESQAAAVAAIGSAAPAEATGPPPAGGIELKSAIDMEIVGENISDIAQFTVEKYEFANDALPPELREKAVSAISGVLWEAVEEVLEHRRRLRAGMFSKAAAALDDVLADANA